MLKNILWAVATIFLLFSSIYFTLKLKFIQLNFKKLKNSLLDKNDSKGVSSIEALFLSLGGRIGVGSIAGVALSIYVGGTGTIFWLWITSFLSISLSFCETVLGNKYKIKVGNGIYNGGPSYYLKNGCNNKKLGILYAFILIISYVVGFVGIQSNTITTSINSIIIIDKYIVGLIITLITILIIFGGVKKIINASNKIVPVMAILYIGVSLIIILLNIIKIPSIIINIIISAFNLKSFFSSFIPMVIVGLQRGIFSSEAGLGTGSVASSVSAENDSIKLGFVQMLGIYISIFICTMTAFVVLISDYNVFTTNINGIELVQSAFRQHLGFLGDIFVFVSILLFSFSTIITGYYYGESGLIFLCKKNMNIKLFVLKFFTVLSVFLGCVISAGKIWDMVDNLVAVLAIINVYGIFKLRKQIFNELDCNKT